MDQTGTVGVEGHDELKKATENATEGGAADENQMNAEVKEAEKLLDVVGAHESDLPSTNQLKVSRSASKCLSIIQSIPIDSHRDRVFGLILGSFIGDSCGSSIDAESIMPNEEQVAHCLKLGGGGKAHIGPG